MPIDIETIKRMTPGEKSNRILQVNTLINELKEELNELNKKPEEILTCEFCGKDIIAYGENGESFITTRKDNVEKYYHNNRVCNSR